MSLLWSKSVMFKTRVQVRSFSRWMGRSLSGATLALAVAVGTLVTMPEAASAQGMRMMTGGMDLSATRMTTRSLEDYSKLLSLDETQKEAATALLDGYMSAHKTATEELEGKFEEMQQKAMESRDWQKMGNESSKLMVEYQDKTRKLEEDMLANLKGLLTPEQTEKWSLVERSRRREKNLRYGFFSGAAVDLVRVINRNKLNAGSEEAKQLIEQYETDMDRKLVEFEKMTREQEEEMRKQAEAGQVDMMSRMNTIDKFSAPSKDLRDLNKDFVRRLGLAMSEEDRAKLENEFAKRAHPRIYRESHPQQQFAAALGFSDLDETQKTTITDLKAQYDRDVKASNTAWAKATENAEDVAGGMVSLMMAQWMPSDKEGVKAAQDEVKKARDARRAVDESFKTRLEQALKLEQRNRLPARKASNDNPWEMWSQPEDDE
ncbi:hypothetical protein LBMAG48_09750 [Phycisphaerae bacterium]|nr:hypothetical protein LBMAG48_09750 [Phycisphaerae bacterium]